MPSAVRFRPKGRCYSGFALAIGHSPSRKLIILGRPKAFRTSDGIAMTSSRSQSVVMSKHTRSSNNAIHVVGVATFDLDLNG